MALLQAYCDDLKNYQTPPHITSACPVLLYLLHYVTGNGLPKLLESSHLTAKFHWRFQSTAKFRFFAAKLKSL